MAKVANSGILSLHSELQAKVLSFLSDDNRETLRERDPHWAQIIEEYFPDRFIIDNSNYSKIQICSWAKDVELKSLTIPVRFYSNFKNVAFEKNVKKLEFSNIVVTYNLLEFLSRFSNLTELTFTKVTVDTPELISSSASEIEIINYTDELESQTKKLGDIEIPLKKLEKFRMNTLRYSKSDLAIFDFLSLPNVQFGSLKEICINSIHTPNLSLDYILKDEGSIIWEKDDEKKAIEEMKKGRALVYKLFGENLLFGDLSVEELLEHLAILKFLRKNRRSLRELKFGRDRSPMSIYFHEYNAFPNCYPIQMKSINMGIIFVPGLWPIFCDKKQVKIESIILEECSDALWNILTQFFNQNSQTLTMLNIGGNSFDWSCWNCNRIKNCKKLTTLYLDMNFCKKTHLELVTTTLHTMNILGPINLREILKISEKMVNLESLRFSRLSSLGLNTDFESEEAEVDAISKYIFSKLLKLPKLAYFGITQTPYREFQWNPMIRICSRLENLEDSGFTFQQLFSNIGFISVLNGLVIQMSQDFKKEQVPEFPPDPEPNRIVTCLETFMEDWNFFWN